MNVRPIQPADFDCWLSLRSALWPHCSIERHTSEMREYCSTGGHFATFVAINSNGELCGFVEASLHLSAEGCTSQRIGYIEGVFVQPAFRRHGIGSLLIAAVERWAVSLGCLEMASDCDAHNNASICFHQWLGFETAKQLVHFRRVLPNAVGHA